MFFVSALGLMIRISPPDARGRVAGMFSRAFLVGSVAGPVLGSLTAGLGLSAPFLIYGVALLIAAAVVFISLRHSSLAAPAEENELTVTRADGAAPPGLPGGAAVQLRHRAGRRSGCGSRWCRCSSPRCCTGAGIAGLGAGDVRGRQRRGGDSAAAAVRPDRPPAAADHRADGGRGGDDGGRRLGDVAAAVPGRCVRRGAATGVFTSPQQAAVADIIGSKARGGTAVATFQMMSDFGSIVGSLRWSGRSPSTCRSGGRSRSAARSCWSPRSGGCSRRKPGTRPGGAHPAAAVGPGGRWRAALNSDFEACTGGGVTSMGTTWGYGAVGSAPHWQCGGQGFESP